MAMGQKDFHCGATRKRKLVTGIVISILTLGLTLIAAEAALRVAIPVDFGTSFAYRIPHQDFGWVLEPDVSYRNVLSEATVRVTYNSGGWRDVEHKIEKPNNVFRILVLGDSFMEAYSVDYEEAFFRRIEKLAKVSGLEVEVINLGVGGYGTLQEYMVFREVGRQYAPDMVLLGFYIGNDVRNNSLELESVVSGDIKANSRPFLNPDDSNEWIITQADFEGAKRRYTEAQPKRDSLENKITARSVLARVVLKSLRRFQRKIASRGVGGSRDSGGNESREVALLGVHYCEMPNEYTRAWHATGRILTRLNKATEEIGSRLIVFTVPAMMEVDARSMEQTIADSHNPERLCLESLPGYGKLASLLVELDIEVIDLLPNFRRVASEDGINLFRRSDGHWNPEGHAIAAEIIASALSDRGLLTASRVQAPLNLN